MSDFNSHVRCQWFPVALSSRVAARPRRVLLFGEPIALGRDQDGQIFALEDRCPHRGVRLSDGKFVDGALSCPYHGWRFDRQGRCISMPGAQGERPFADIRAPSLSAEERDGIVWVARGPRQGLPARLLDMKPGRQRFLWETTWHAPILEAQENFLDALHTHTIHRGLVRRATPRREVTVTLCTTDDGFHVDYTGQSSQSGVLFMLFESRRTRERAYFSGLSVGQLEYQYAAGWAAYITLCFCPETATTTRVFAMLHLEGRRAARWLVRLIAWPLLRKVAHQDQRILESQARNLCAFPSHRHVVTPLDVVRPHLERAWRGDEVKEHVQTEVLMCV